MISVLLDGFVVSEEFLPTLVHRLTTDELVYARACLASLIMGLLGLEFVMHLEGGKQFGSLVRIIREMAFSEEVVSFIVIMCMAVVFFTTSIVMLDLTGSFAFGDAEWPIDDPEALGWWFWRTFQHVYRIGIIGDVDFDNIA